MPGNTKHQQMLAVVITLSYLLSFDSNKCNTWTCNICWGGGNSLLAPLVLWLN